MLRSHRFSWLALALVFWIANLALHLEFSNLLVASYQTAFGAIVPRDFAGEFGILLALAIGLYVFAGSKSAYSPRFVFLIFSIWGLLMLGLMFTLTTTTIELVHFPQYALIAYLFAKALDPDRSGWPLLDIALLVFWLSLLDELNQYFFLTPANSSYVDFNDFILNLVGICGGLYLYYAFHQPPQSHVVARGLRNANFSLYVPGICLLVLGTILERIVYSPLSAIEPGGIAVVNDSITVYLQREPGLLSSWQPSFLGGNYYVTGALEFAVIAIVLLFFLSRTTLLIEKTIDSKDNERR